MMDKLKSIKIDVTLAAVLSVVLGVLLVICRQAGDIGLARVTLLSLWCRGLFL